MKHKGLVPKMIKNIRQNGTRVGRERASFWNQRDCNSTENSGLSRQVEGLCVTVVIQYVILPAFCIAGDAGWVVCIFVRPMELNAVATDWSTKGFKHFLVGVLCFERQRIVLCHGIACFVCNSGPITRDAIGMEPTESAVELVPAQKYERCEGVIANRG